MLKHQNNKGMGLIEVMIFFAVIAIVFTTALNFLNQQYSSRAFLRKNYLATKSFGGAEIVLIDQRQCRCNFQALNVPVNVAFDDQLTIPRLKTYEDTDACADQDVDAILAETNQNIATQENRTNEIMMTNWSVIIPQMLYRARVNIFPNFGSPVNFPVLFSGTAQGGRFLIEACGVDRDS